MLMLMLTLMSTTAVWNLCFQITQLGRRLAHGGGRLDGAKRETVDFPKMSLRFAQLRLSCIASPNAVFHFFPLPICLFVDGLPITATTKHAVKLIH